MACEETSFRANADGDDRRRQCATCCKYQDSRWDLDAYLPTGGLVCDFVEGDLCDSARCKPVLTDASLKDVLVLVDLPAPYRDEKLSE